MISISCDALASENSDSKFTIRFSPKLRTLMYVYAISAIETMEPATSSLIQESATKIQVTIIIIVGYNQCLQMPSVC